MVRSCTIVDKRYIPYVGVLACVLYMKRIAGPNVPLIEQVRGA